MTDSMSGGAERGELILPIDESAIVEEQREMVSEPAKVMRVGSMIKQLLDEVRQTELDEPSRVRLRAIYDTSIDELGSALSPDLRVAQAQLVGWLEGLFHGIQATLFAQQMAARQQLENMRGELPPGAGRPGSGMPEPEDRPGTYL